MPGLARRTLGHLLVDERHEVDEVGRGPKDGLAVLAVAEVLVAKEVGEPGDLLQEARDLGAHVPDGEVGEHRL